LGKGVPRGQSQPHQNLPRARVASTVMMAGAKVGIALLAASIVLRPRSGSRRAKRLTGIGDPPSRVVLTKRYRNRARAKYWIS